MPKPTSDLKWKDTYTPVSTRFDDPYFSLQDGLAETRHVFLRGNDLPARFRSGFHVAELGFGTGLNFLATLALWRDSSQIGKLHFTSFEAFPLSIADLTHALTPFNDILPVDILLDDDTFTPHIIGDDFELSVIIGDARDTLPNWQGRADAWFLDGFSPNKNPELWGAPLMQAVADHTTPHGTFATYSAAGHIRGALSDAGFTVERTQGHGTKRHMTRGQKH